VCVCVCVLDVDLELAYNGLCPLSILRCVILKGLI
jgi:hypothetical protein